MIMMFLIPSQMSVFAQNPTNQSSSGKFYKNSISYRYALDNVGYNYLLRYDRSISKNHRFSVNAETGYGVFGYRSKDYKLSNYRSFIFSPGIETSTYRSDREQRFFDWDVGFQLTFASGQIFDRNSKEVRYRLAVVPNFSVASSLRLNDFLFAKVTFRYGWFNQYIHNHQEDHSLDSEDHVSK